MQKHWNPYACCIPELQKQAYHNLFAENGKRTELKANIFAVTPFTIQVVAAHYKQIADLHVELTSSPNTTRAVK